MESKTWVALFSQTGSEIVGLSYKLNRLPDIIFTNNQNPETWHAVLRGMLPSGRVIATTTKQINSKLLRATNSNLFITLHGYLRILPPEVCEKHTIYNGHPGDIVRYPELIGKDPQQKAIDLKLPTTGVVLHRVIPAVDEGPVVARDRFVIPENYTTNQLISSLKELQLDMWYKFLKDELA